MMDEIEDKEAELIAAEYALGLLTPQEAEAFEVLLGDDATFRADYARWAEDFAAMTDDVSPVDPPEAMLARIQAAAGMDAANAAAFETVAVNEDPAHDVAAPAPSAPAGDNMADKAQSWLQRLGLLPPVLGGLAAAMLVLWLINVSGVFGPTVPMGQVTLASADNALVVEVAYEDSGETLTINRTAGDIPEGQSLELWLIADGADPVSLGVLPAEETAMVTVAYALRDKLHGASCAISIEPLGGSPTGAPTGEVIAAAPIIWS